MKLPQARDTCNMARTRFHPEGRSRLSGDCLVEAIHFRHRAVQQPFDVKGTQRSRVDWWRLILRKDGIPSGRVMSQGLSLMRDSRHCRVVGRHNHCTRQGARINRSLPVLGQVHPDRPGAVIDNDNNDSIRISPLQRPCLRVVLVSYWP
ncbi:hypothetical protein D5S17_11725 [Pseudonocardiaceae bacterium YIM PH 21723]|nr:hypothetical protein D5S17_11725 [Pseudonocardiaceae bacterium YIM PH 21723]